MRFKRRYFCVEILFNDEIKSSDKILVHKLKHTNLSNVINKSIEKFFGDYGVAAMMPSFSVIYYNSTTNVAILRTARDLQKKFHTLLALIQRLDDWKVTLSVIHVSGSIKKCKKFLLTYCQARLNELNEKVQKNNEMEMESKMIIDGLETMANVCQVNDSLFIMKN